MKARLQRGRGYVLELHGMLQRVFKVDQGLGPLDPHLFLVLQDPLVVERNVSEVAAEIGIPDLLDL
jgi:hypothetical protein